MRHIGPCLCGATDCPSCGPAQGYEVVRRWNPLTKRYTWVNPDENEDEASTVEDREPDYENREYHEPIEAEWARWRDE